MSQEDYATVPSSRTLRKVNKILSKENLSMQNERKKYFKKSKNKIKFIKMKIDN